MILKLKIQWPGSARKQIIISQRLTSDPYGDIGFYIASRGESIVMGTGGHGSNETTIHNSFPPEAWLEINPNCLTWGWGEEANETAGLMFFTPLGDTLYIGEDPQMPGAKFEGSIEIID